MVIRVESSVNLCLLSTHPRLMVVSEYLELTTLLLPLILVQVCSEIYMLLLHLIKMHIKNIELMRHCFGHDFKTLNMLLVAERCRCRIIFKHLQIPFFLCLVNCFLLFLLQFLESWTPLNTWSSSTSTRISIIWIDRLFRSSQILLPLITRWFLNVSNFVKQLREEFLVLRCQLSATTTSILVDRIQNVHRCFPGTSASIWYIGIDVDNVNFLDILNLEQELLSLNPDWDSNIVLIITHLTHSSH